MKQTIVTAALGFSLLLASAPIVRAGQVESEVLHTIRPIGKMRDTAMSGEGKYFFVLNDASQIEIFEAGRPKGTLNVAQGVSGIKSNAKGDILFLANGDAGTIEIANVLFTEEISSEGSPFKGPEKAAVEVAIFSDFQ